MKKQISTRKAYGQNKLTLLDHFGVYLSSLAIKRNLPKTKDIVVLDIGCGYHASLLLSLADRMKQGIGIDFTVSPGLHLQKKYQFIEMPIEIAMEKLQHIFPDVIMLISVFEHLHDPLNILKNCYRLLKKNGVILINVPTWTGKVFLEFAAFKLKLAPAIEMDDHKMYYSKRDLWPLLVKAGFKPSKIKLHYHKFGLNLFAVVTKS